MPPSLHDGTNKRECHVRQEDVRVHRCLQLKEDADADYDVLKELHHQKVVGSYNVAVISKDDDGKVHVSKHEKPTQHGAWSGLGVGALIGVIFPPSVVAMGALGAVTGGLIGHFRHGMPRAT